MKRTSPERIKQEQEELKEWQMELTDVQKLLPVEAARNKLVAREIPELEQSIKEKQKEIPLLTDAANNVRTFCFRTSRSFRLLNTFVCPFAGIGQA
jgi:hypothetical protein